MAALGAYIIIPGPTGSIALDSAPGFIAVIILGPGEGAVVLGLGHLLSAVRAGMPLGPAHFLIAFLMAAIAPVYSYVWKKAGPVGAGFVGVLMNGVVINGALIPVFGAAFFWTLLLPLSLAAALNIFMASLMIFLLQRRLEHGIN
ncbi:MAG: ECF transporter S component [Bacillota bacterium]